MFPHVSINRSLHLGDLGVGGTVTYHWIKFIRLSIVIYLQSVHHGLSPHSVPPHQSTTQEPVPHQSNPPTPPHKPRETHSLPPILYSYLAQTELVNHLDTHV